MAIELKTDNNKERNPIWWTTLIVAISTTVIGTGLRMLTGAISSTAEEPSYFPLLFLLVAFFSALLTVIVYKMTLPQLPSNWIIRGFLVGIFLFVMGDLPYALITGYGTALSGMVARNMAIAALINRVINGCILTYAYQRISIRKDS